MTRSRPNYWTTYYGVVSLVCTRTLGPLRALLGVLHIFRRQNYFSSSHRVMKFPYSAMTNLRHHADHELATLLVYVPRHPTPSPLYC
jgi:hypothetical protein